MNRRELIASVLGIAGTGLRSSPIASGPWIQEFLLYRKPTQRRLLHEAADLGCRALGLNLFPVVAGGTESVKELVPFNGHDLSRPTSPYLERLEALADLCDRLGILLVTFGPSFPDVRRLHPTFLQLRFRNRAISILDWAAWADRAHEAWSYHQRRVDNLVGVGLIRVDGVEPHTWALSAPPNRFTRMMAADFTGMRASGTDHLCFNPTPNAAVPTAEIVTSDGWGNSRYLWTWGPRFTGSSGPIRRPLAALPDHIRLPAGVSPKARIAEYFTVKRDLAQRQGSKLFLVLHTPGWRVSTNAEANEQAQDHENYEGHPGVASLYAPPFGAIYRSIS